MSTSSLKNSAWLIKSLDKIANALALIPPTKRNCNFNATRYKIFSVIVSLTFLIASAFSLYGRSITIYLQMNTSKTAIFIDIITEIVLTALVCTAIFRSAFVNIEKYELIVEMFTKIDKELNWNNANSQNENKFLAMLITAHLFMLFLIMFDIALSLKVDQASVACYIVWDIENYYCLIIIFLIYSYTMNLRNRLSLANSLFNTILQEESVDIHNERYIEVRAEPMIHKWSQVYKIRAIFNIINQLIETFNSIFGWEILLIVISVVVRILSFVYVIICVFLNEETLNNEILSLSQQEALWYATLWCATVMVSYP